MKTCSAIVHVSPALGAGFTEYTAEFEAGTVAVQIGKELWVGSFRSDRIAIFPAP